MKAKAAIKYALNRNQNFKTLCNSGCYLNRGVLPIHICDQEVISNYHLRLIANNSKYGNKRKSIITTVHAHKPNEITIKHTCIAAADSISLVVRIP